MGKRSRGGDPTTTLEAGRAVVRAHAQWWSPDPKSEIEASPSSAVEGADGAISAWVADECNRFSGQRLTPGKQRVRIW